jgi:hypothetical protein
MNTFKQHKKHATTFSYLTLLGVLAISTLANLAEAGVCGRLGARPNCVNSKDVKDDNLTAIDLKDEAGADFAEGDQDFLLTSGTDVVRSVTVTAPTAGQVMVNASGSFLFGDTAAFEFVNCSITTAAAVDNTNRFRANEATVSAYFRLPFAATRGFVVPAGSTTFNLACTGSTTVHIEDSNLTAIFVPTVY